MPRSLYEDVHVWINFATRRHSKRMEGVGSGERVPILLFVPLDCVGEVFSSLACCVLEVGAYARVDDDEIKE